MTATTHMKLSRSWVMNRAWYYLRIWGAPKLTRFDQRRALKFAWSDMRAKMQGLRLVDEVTAHEKELASLEAKEFTTAAERQKMQRLREAIHHEAVESDYAAKRELIAAAPCVVAFIKADGSERTMRVDTQALAARAKVSEASKTGQRATANRKARHPHLLPVWDVDAAAPRSVNLATLTRVETAQGVRHYRT